ncbi:hypothetical protein DENSPDRAFT_679744 [Dentipellis sp. KUC8613]|nr:hypothetical protein DENSPDRAFT_679744 [Dentipellis sp. KUC8613]
MDVSQPSRYPPNMSPGELPYPPQQSQQGQPSQQPQWSSAPHLLPPAHAPPAFAGNPSNSAPPLGDQQQQQQQQQHYPNYYQQGPAGGQAGLPDSAMLDRPTTLSLNLSSLSVASPTNLSPINQSPHTSTATSGVSPITPISPSNPNIQGPSPFGAHHHPPSHPPGAYGQHAPPPSQPQFSFAPPDQGQGIRYEDPHYDLSARRMGLSSRSSSSSEKSVPRKRSFTAGPLPTNIEEASMFDGTGGGNGANGAMQLDGPGDGYDEVDMTYSSVDPNGSPIDDSTSGGEQDDQLKPLIDAPMASGQQGPHSMASQASGMNVIGKPMGTNNFVTKLYQMINDPKSAHFIAWTELGTSFVVSNVGEFSRSILGSHFKHNNFSSFVRQLNMYGFHKINRTPRAQRTSTDAQTWEFSHHKFLRGRPDLLEEIKRKALEPDPSIKHRVELPGEVAAQLAQMREEQRRVTGALNAERARFERLAIVTKSLFDVVEKNFPGWLPAPFPADILEPSDNPNIFVTSPNMTVPSHGLAPMSTLSSASASLHSLSPASSPTTSDFPAHAHHHAHHSHSHTPHSLSRQQSFHYDGPAAPAHHLHGRYDTPLSTPLPPSPGPSQGAAGQQMDFDERGGKRQRTAAGQGEVKRLSRARSDSAPLGYGAMNVNWAATRPRSGSGLVVRPARGDAGMGMMGVPNIGRAIGQQGLGKPSPGP